MSQLELFGAPGALPLSPGQNNRLDAQRAAWRKRQRRCRARRKMAARVAGVAPVEPFDARNFTAQKWPGVEVFDYTIAVQVILGMIQRPGKLCDLVFYLLEEPIFYPPFDLVWEVARALHDEGARVTAAAVRARLKREGVTLLDDCRAFENLKTCEFAREADANAVYRSAAIVQGYRLQEQEDARAA